MPGLFKTPYKKLSPGTIKRITLPARAAVFFLIRYSSSSLLFITRRKFNTFSIVIFTLAIISFPSLSNARTVRVGVFPASPLVDISENRPQGFFIDLIEHFSLFNNWKLEYVNGTWSELLKKLETGEIDILPATGYNRERTGIFDYNRDPVYIDHGVLFTRPGLRLHTIFDLQKKRVAALDGSIYTTGFIEYISSFGIGCRIIYTKDNFEVIRAVEKGDADAGVCIYSLGNELAKKHKVTVTPISFSPVALHFAVPRGKNADVISAIDSLMPDMINNPDSVYGRSFRKWTVPSPEFSIPSWLIWSVAFLSSLGLLLGLWSIVLKRQVNSKTKYLAQEISERKQTETRLTQSLKEKETLIRELYHRTKNTMQVIRGMLVLQADDYRDNDDIRQLVKNTEDRIQAISLVHQMLYRSQDLSHISIRNYIEELTSLILEGFSLSPERITLVLDIEDQDYLLDTAIPFGLILNELMTNSIKHAFPGGTNGCIRIKLSGAGPGKNVLHYSDNGKGVPEGFEFHNRNTLGLRLIQNISELQLLGKVTFKNGSGVSCMIEFSTDLYSARI